jgi:hypothetical protein
MPLDSYHLRDALRLLDRSLSLNCSQDERDDYRTKFVREAQKAGAVVGPSIVRFVSHMQVNGAVGRDFYQRLIRIVRLPLCPLCKLGRGEQKQREAIRTKHGEPAMIQEPYSQCDSCGGEFYTEEQTELLHQRVVEALADDEATTAPSSGTGSA